MPKGLRSHPFTGDFDRLNYAGSVEMRLIDAHLAVVALGVARRAAMVNDVPLIGARHLQHTRQYLPFLSVTAGAHIVRRTHFTRAVSTKCGCLVLCTRSGDENASRNTCWLQDIRVLGSVWLAGYMKPWGPRSSDKSCIAGQKWPLSARRTSRAIRGYWPFWPAGFSVVWRSDTLRASVLFGTSTGRQAAAK